jgi:hypothetical protein
VALLGFGLQHVDEDHVPDGQLRRGLGVATVELAIRNDTFALGADIDEDLVGIDANDRAFDDIAMLEALDVSVLLGEELPSSRARAGSRPGPGPPRAPQQPARQQCRLR